MENHVDEPDEFDRRIKKYIGELHRSFRYQPGRFYGSATNVSLGVGVICSKAPYVLYDPIRKRMGAVRGLALVLTHECDLANDRFACEDLLICPIIPVENLLAAFSKVEAHLENFIDALAKDMVSRLFYLPPLTPFLKNGGILPLNQITTTRIEWFSRKTERIAALSEYAAFRVDRKLENHLLRSKADQLPRY